MIRIKEEKRQSHKISYQQQSTLKKEVRMEPKLTLGKAYRKIDGIVATWGKAEKDEQVAEAFLLVMDNTDTEEHQLLVVKYVIERFNPGNPIKLSLYDFPEPWEDEREFENWAKYNSEHSQFCQNIIAESHGSSEVAARMIYGTLKQMDSVGDERICFMEMVFFAGLCPYTFAASVAI